MNFLYILKTNLIKRSSRDKDEVFHTLLHKGLNNKTLDGTLSSASIFYLFILQANPLHPFMPCKLGNHLSRRIVAFSPDKIRGKLCYFGNSIKVVKSQTFIYSIDKDHGFLNIFYFRLLRKIS